MTDPFADKMYAAMLDVLALVERLRKSGVGQVPAADVARLRSHVDRIDDVLAQRLLVYWIDEVLINANLPCSAHWKHHTLEFERYQSQRRASLYYEDARQASAAGRIDALTLAFLGVALGFRGDLREGAVHRLNLDTAPGQAVAPPQPAPAAPQAPPGFFTNPKLGGLQPSAPAAAPQGLLAGLPTSLDEWVKSVYSQIVRPLSRFQPQTQPEAAGDCAPLRGRVLFRFWSTVSVFLAVLAGALILALLFVSRS